MNTRTRLQNFLRRIARPQVIIPVYVVFALAASIQAILITNRPHTGDDPKYTAYNNYTIFKHAFHHLTDDQDLYIHYPAEHHDLFKYTPTFALVFGVFAVIPDWLGLFLWNLLNAVALLAGVYLLPKLDRFQKGAILLLCAVDMLTNLQNDQSNGLVAGLIVLGFALLERNKYGPATLALISTAFVKIFGIGACVLYLFYPKKWKLASYTVLWILILAALPFLLISPEQYMLQCESWLRMLSEDHSASLGLSVMGILESWFGITAKYSVVVGGLVLFILPFARIRKYLDYRFRLLALASVLIWVVIFNHKAESNTFILAITGAAIWFVTGQKNAVNTALLILAVILSTLSPTDLFPRSIRDSYVIPYALKALPYVLIWMKIVYEMLTMREESAVEVAVR